MRRRFSIKKPGLKPWGRIRPMWSPRFPDEGPGWEPPRGPRRPIGTDRIDPFPYFKFEREEKVFKPWGIPLEKKIKKDPTNDKKIPRPLPNTNRSWTKKKNNVDSPQTPLPRP